MSEIPSDPAAIRTLADRLDAADAETRVEAMTALEALAEEHPARVAWVGGAIRAGLDDDEPRVRAGACRLVGELGLEGERVRERLRERRLDVDPEVSDAAAAALDRLDDVEHVEPIAPPEPTAGDFDPTTDESDPAEPPSPAGPWPAIHGGPRARSRAPDATVPHAEPALRRQLPTDDAPDAVLVGDGGTVYVGDAGSIRALNVSDERLGGFSSAEWTVPTGDGRREPVAMAGGTVYTDGDVLGAIDAADGSELWRIETDGSGTSTATLRDGKLYAAGTDCFLSALSAADGTELWRVDIDTGHTARPTVAGGTVYAAAHHDRTVVSALSVEDGTERWRFEYDGLPSRPVVDDGAVYVGYGDLVALDAEDGTERWRTDLQKLSPPAVADDALYLATPDGACAVDRTDGSVRWSVDGLVSMFDTAPTPAVADGVVLYNGSDVVALDAEDGAELWRIEAGEQPQRPAVAVGRETALFARSDGVYAVSDEK